MFKERLVEFRSNLGLNKRQMANKLGMNESYYNMVESGKRNPSKTVMDNLVALSGKPEEYWIYGIVDDKEYIDSRKEFKCTGKAVEQLLELGFNNELFQNTNGDEIVIKKGSIEELLIAALKADIEHIKLKKEQ